MGGVPLSLSITPSAVPVPAAVWLFGSGLLGLVGVARRRKLA
ncbi:MAG: VPLPA-CTERM sorting domain-containing protein [Gammaproteobacteria bacterium]|nr:VPLPA-CTERM sorting domain-containing protein [Gammaproteobacteria bacterium]